MSTIPNWETSSVAWDTVILGGYMFPGVSTADGVAGRKLDVKNVRGQDKSRIKDGGYQPGKVTIECVIWDPEDLNTLSNILDAINPRPGTTRTALQIAHPSIAAIGITQVYVESISSPKLDKGKLTTKITCLEWTAEPAEARTSATSGSAATPVAGETTAFDQHEAQTNSRNRPTGAPPAAAVSAGRRS